MPSRTGILPVRRAFVRGSLGHAGSTDIMDRMDNMDKLGIMHPDKPLLA